MSWLLPPLPPKWDAALRDVHAKDLRARIAATERLSRPSDEQREAAIDALLTLAGDKDARVRALALEGLAGLSNPRTLDALARAMDDADPYVREVAAIAISHLPREVSEPVMLQSAGSPHPEIRFQAASALAEHFPEHAEPVLRRLINDSDVRVRASAVQAADSLAHASRSADLMRSLSEALRDGDLRVRGEAAILFAKLGDARATGSLLEALEDAELVWSALDAAPGLPDPRVVEQVAVIAQSFLRSRLLKAAAARALVRMGDARGIAALREVIGSLRGEGRTYAVEIIGELSVQTLAPLIASLVRRPRGVDPVTLAKSLIKLSAQSPEARAALRVLAERDDEAGALSHAELTRSDVPGIAAGSSGTH